MSLKSAPNPFRSEDLKLSIGTSWVVPFLLTELMSQTQLELDTLSSLEVHFTEQSSFKGFIIEPETL